MTSKELYAIREWAPLTDIFDRIPTRMQRLGLFPLDLNITSVDAIAEFLALGSDAGVVFWYDRHAGDVQKLKTEVTTRITCVKIVDSVEYMVAAGHANGLVSVFQIQKVLPPDLNLVAPCTRAKPIQRFTIRDLHQKDVRCLEWSKNGMKLYSGDCQGVVVLTEFDYQMHLSKSMEIISEAYEIVQLSVHQSYLLVSTLYRSIVCSQSKSGQWNIIQVGRKDRKQLIDCGGIFLKRPNISKVDNRPFMICGRPGMRFWIADTGGNVEKTLLFKEPVTTRSPTWEIPILNPKSTGVQLRDNSPEVIAQNFCKLHLYAGTESLVVTHDDAYTLYILNLDRLRVEAVARGFRKILDFCVCDKEIFILEGERSLLRLAPLPDKPNKTAKIIFNPQMPPPVPQLGLNTCGTFESPVELEPDVPPINNAEECFELPPIEAINLEIPIELAIESPRGEQNRRLEIFQQISRLDFDQSILHHTGISNINRRKKRKSREPTRPPTKTAGIVEIAQAAQVLEAPQANPKTIKPTLMDISYCNEAKNVAEHLQESQLHHLSDLFSSTILTETKEEKDTTLSELLEQPHVRPAPTSDKKLSQLQASNETLTTSQTTVANPLMQLSVAYPQHIDRQMEDAGVQTTPRKAFYYADDTCDYSAGQPVDEIICQTLMADKSLGEPQAAALKFVPTQPSSEIDSFLLDFRRARDPLRRKSPPSAESNTSSEWEFVEN